MVLDHPRQRGFTKVTLPSTGVPKRIGPDRADRHRVGNMLDKAIWSLNGGTVCYRLRSFGFLALALFALAPEVYGQIPVVIHGRVEDAVSGNPVPGAQVLSADSATAVLTDSLGIFALPLSGDTASAVHVEQFGYLSQRFELESDAPSRISVLRLEPSPIALEGIEVVDDAALTTILRRLENRRQAYGRAMSAFDRERLERFSPAGSVLDFVRRRHSVRECGLDGTQLCTTGRVRTLQSPDGRSGIPVCIDGSRSPAPVLELASLEAGSMALIEVYGGWRPSEIRVYTPRHLAWKARTGQTQVLPLWIGC